MLMVAEFSITVWSVTAATSEVGMASITCLHSLLAISTTSFDMVITLKCRNSPLCNLWLTMLQTAGIPADSFSDSTLVQLANY